MDLLLSMDYVPGYQSYPTRGHGQVGAMSVAEQVAGRRNRIQFEIVLDADQVDRAIAALKKALPIRDVVFWVLPVFSTGRLSD